MKSASRPRQSPTIAKRSDITAESQVVVLLDAPCRNRTYNLMIKSQIRRLGLTRTGSAQPLPAPVNIAALVPQEYPIAARTSRRTHTPFSIPDPFADEKIWEVYGWVL